MGAPVPLSTGDALANFVTSHVPPSLNDRELKLPR